jgi:hypothetical protein
MGSQATRPPRLGPGPAPLPSFATLCLVAAGLFGGGFLLTKSNPNAGLLLVAAGVLAGLSIVALAFSALRRFSGDAPSRSGRSERDLVVIGTLVVALATPWSVEIAMARAPQIFGWQNPLAWLVAVVILASSAVRFHRYRGHALALGGAGLAAWVLWLSTRLLTPEFSSLSFSFLPTDLIGEGWYIALLGWVIALDGVIARSADEEAPLRMTDLLGLALVPGAALIRLGHKVRGRLWLAVAGFVVFLIYAGAVNPLEFQDFAYRHGLPPSRPRGSGVGVYGLLVVVWLLSVVDTGRTGRVDRPLT